MILTLPATQWIKIIHLNIRGYLHHINDLKQDNIICSSDIICLTETHLRKSDVLHINSQPNKHYTQYRKDRFAGVDKGGIIMFINPNINSTCLNINIPQLEFLAATTSLTPENKLIIRWFKFTLKPPYTIVHGNLSLAIWDTSHWTSFVKFGLKTA